MEVQFPDKRVPEARGEHEKAEKEGSIVGDGRYVLGACIGSGSFARVYEGTELLSPKSKVAIKVQAFKHPGLCAMSIAECEVMTRLKGGIGIPKLLWSGIECGCHLIIMEMLGPSLIDLQSSVKYSAKKKGFSMKTVARIGLQMISRLEFMHGHGVVHRDVKPDNMLMGRGTCCNTVFLIDYGLYAPWMHSDSGHHFDAKPVLPAANKSITGTHRYCSVNVHQGQVYSRRDDLISLCYSLVYMHTSWLPWMRIEADTKTATMDMILEKKLSCAADVLCANLPVDFMRFVSACFNMGFSEQPDYRYLSSMIYSIAKANSFYIDIGPWDWQLAGAANRMAEMASSNLMVDAEVNMIRMNMQWIREVLDQDHHKARVHKKKNTRARRRTGTNVAVLREQSAPPIAGSRKQVIPRDDLVTPVTGGFLKIGYQKLIRTERHCTPPASSPVLPKIPDDQARFCCLPCVSSLLRSRPPVQKVTVVTQPRKSETVV